MSKRYLGGDIYFEQKVTSQEFSEESGGGGGGSSTLSGLTDVDISNPTDGQTLVYDAASQKWVNGAGGGGGARIVSVNSVTEYTPEGAEEPESWDGTLNITVGGLLAAFSGSTVSPLYLHVPEFGHDTSFSYDATVEFGGFCPLFPMQYPYYSVLGDAQAALGAMYIPLESFTVVIDGHEPNAPVLFHAEGVKEI